MNDCLTEVVFYYQLKLVKSSGFFKKDEIIKTILKKGIANSKGSAYYKLNKLLKTSLIKETKTGYSLVSYDSLFGKLGYRMEYNRKRKRRGFFLLHKIQEINLSKVLYWIQYVDIRDSLKKQRINLYKNLKSNRVHTEILNHYTESTCLEYFDKVVSKNLVEHYKSFKDDIDCLLYQKLSHKRIEVKPSPNLDITLSLNGVCRILGLTNVSSARNILLKLKEEFFLDIERRLIETTSNYSNIYYKFIDGVKYANLSNKISYLM